MVNQTIIEKLEQGNQYLIEGDDINEVIEYCMTKIRAKSQDFYRASIIKDLTSNGESLIDFHAGLHNWYKIRLINVVDKPTLF